MNKPLFFVDKLEQIEVCGNIFYSLEGSEYRLPQKDFFITEKGDHNFENCQDCQKHYQKILLVFEEKVKEFPFCCDHHSKLIKMKEFNRSDFLHIPALSTDKLFHTYDFILKYIEDENWYDIISEYIYYIIDTFGAFPKDKGEPLLLSFFLDYLKNLVVHKLKNSKNEYKIEGFVEIIKTYRYDSKRDKKEGGNAKEFNLLLQTYNRWYKIFPFEFILFNSLKEVFSSNLPLFDKVSYNRYLNVSLLKPVTISQLIKILEEITLSILSNNSLTISKLYEENKVDDLAYYQFQILSEQRSLKLKKKLAPESFKTFIKSIKEWLKDEKKYIEEILKIEPFLKNPKENLLNDVLESCNKMQENKLFWNKHEDEKTKQILDILTLKYKSKDQPTYGSSTGGKRGGSVDGVLYNNNIEHFIEALNLQNINKNYIKTHITKLEKGYDSKGLKIKFLIIYYNGNTSFSKFSERYFHYIRNEYKFDFELINSEIVTSNYAEQEIIRTSHKRNNINVILYHIILNINRL